MEQTVVWMGRKSLGCGRRSEDAVRFLVHLGWSVFRFSRIRISAYTDRPSSVFYDRMTTGKNLLKLYASAV